MPVKRDGVDRCPPFQVALPTNNVPPTNNVVNLVWPAGTTLPPIVPATTPPSTIPSPYLGRELEPGYDPVDLST